ncbi:MAG: transposase [Anaerolineales bacterium]
MNKLRYQPYYRRHLPHIQPPGATFFITFRLANSLPPEVLERLQAQRAAIEIAISKIANDDEKRRLQEAERKKWFAKWDDALDQATEGDFYLREPVIAATVANSIRFHDGEWFDVIAYCIMPNHVHLVITPFEKITGQEYSLSEILHNIKRNSAKQANKILGKSGDFWQHESYDHFVRSDAELERVVKYVLHNPVKAGLCKEWTDWRWSYSKYPM